MQARPSPTGPAVAAAGPAALSATEALAQCRAGRLTAAQWLAGCAGRIAGRDALIQAWAHLDLDAAAAAARALDQSGAARSAPLAGLPVGVKDVIDVAGMPTRCNSPTTDDLPPAAADALCVERLRGAGAVIVGKTVTTEYAFTEPGPTRNPHDPSRTPGGSSSGSAAAVADHQVPVALATQTGGSTIRPAAYCGVVGYKPPYGLIPTRGLRYLAPSMDHIGVHARTVADMALVAGVLEDRAHVAVPVRPAALETVVWPDSLQPTPAVAEVFGRAIERLRAAGVSILTQAPVAEFDAIDPAHRVLMAAEVARSFRQLMPQRGQQLSASLREFIGRGEAASTEELAAALALVARVGQRLYPAAERGALLISPSTLDTAPVGLHATGSALLNRPWSILGLAVMTVPAGVAADGLPVGLQLIDPHPAGDRLFGAAAFIESVLQSHL